jgi:DNA repair exonuclease SbcCD ATPase subunit
LKRTEVDRKKVKAEAKSEAATIMAAEQTKVQSMIEETLEEAKTRLLNLEAENEKVMADNTKLSDQNAEVQAAKEELETQLADVQKQNEELKAELDKAKKEIDTLSSTISNMEKEAAVQTRLKELHELDLVSAGKVADKQKNRIKSMNDEEFAEYKDELLSLRQAWETKKSEETKTADAAQSTETPAAAAKPEDTEEDAEDLENEDPKALASKVVRMRRAMAAVNIPTKDTDLDEQGLDRKLVAKFAGMWEDK